MTTQFSRVATNVGAITIADVSGRFLSLALYAAIARFFGSEGLGGYATCAAIAAYFVVAVDFGLAPRLVREGAVDPDSLATEYARAMGWKVAATALAVPALVGLYFVLPYEVRVRQLCVMFSAAAILKSFSFLNHSVCRARERLELEAVSSVAHSVLLVGGSLACVFTGLPLLSLGLVWLGAGVAQLVLSGYFARKFTRFGIALPPHRPTGRASAPYATTSLTAVAFSGIDVLILSVIASQEVVGQYASVSRLLLVTGLLAVAALGAVLPTASRFFARSDPERFREVVSEALRFVLVLGGGVVVAIFLAARLLLGLIYGSEFESLHPLLRGGSIFVALKFLNSVSSIMLTACGRQALRARAVVGGLVATVVLVMGLVPIWGLAGAIVALVLSEAAMGALQMWSLWDYLRPGLLLRATASLLFALAGSVVAFLLLSRAGQPLWLHLVVPSLAYAAIILVSGEATRALDFLRRQRGVASNDPPAARPT